jgi:hypothetical protein
MQLCCHNTRHPVCTTGLTLPHPLCTALHCTALHCTALHCTALPRNCTAAPSGRASIMAALLPIRPTRCTTAQSQGRPLAHRRRCHYRYHYYHTRLPHLKHTLPSSRRRRISMRVQVSPYLAPAWHLAWLHLHACYDPPPPHCHRNRLQQPPAAGCSRQGLPSSSASTHRHPYHHSPPPLPARTATLTITHRHPYHHSPPPLPARTATLTSTHRHPYQHSPPPLPALTATLTSTPPAPSRATCTVTRPPQAHH